MTGRKLLAHGLTDIGSSKTRNEDAFLVDPDLGLYVVSDGMGGLPSADPISRTVCQMVRGEIQNDYDEIQALFSAADQRQLTDRIAGAVQRVGLTIHRLARRSAELTGAGATVTLLLNHGERAVLAHVGDSRAYLARGERLHQLTTDHNHSEQTETSGVMAALLDQSEQESTLTRSLGLYATVAVDTLVIDLFAGDTFLLCTDGLSRCLDDQRCLVELRGADPVETTQRLIEISRQTGAPDDITAVVIRVPTDESTKPLDMQRSGLLELKRTLLAESLLFDGLSWRDLAHVLTIARVHDVDQGEVLQYEDQPKQRLVVVLFGELELRREGRTTRRLRPAEWFGISSLLDDSVAGVQLLASKNSRIVAIDAAELDYLFVRQRSLGHAVLKNLAQRYFTALVEQDPQRAAD